MDTFVAIFSKVPDPRDLNAQHDLSEILFIAVAASLCGAEACTAFAEFGRAKEPLLRRFLVLKHGVPSHDTFSRVFRVLDPEALGTALQGFVAAIGRALGHAAEPTAGQVVAVDGKRLRGAYDRGRASVAPILVSAYLNHTRMALAQTLAPGGGEVKGVLALLELVALKGATVTGDALHCTAKTARAIRDRGADYVLALKGNRATLAQEADEAFEAAGPQAPSLRPPGRATTAWSTASPPSSRPRARPSGIGSRACRPSAASSPGASRMARPRPAGSAPSRSPGR